MIKIKSIDSLRKDMGSKIKYLRKNFPLKMNQKDLSKILGISPSYLCAVEKGEDVLSVEKLKILVSHLGGKEEIYKMYVDFIYFKNGLNELC